MKIKNFMFLSLIFVLLFSLSFSVLGQRTDAADAQQVAEQATISLVEGVNKAVDWLFGVSFIDLNIFVITFAIFFILAIVFSDALITFSPLSRKASIAIGIILAIISSVLKAPRVLAEWLLGITAVVGVFSVFATLIVVFVTYLVVHLLIFKSIVPLFWKPEARGAQELEGAIRGLRKAHKALREKV